MDRRLAILISILLWAMACNDVKKGDKTSDEKVKHDTTKLLSQKKDSLLTVQTQIEKQISRLKENFYFVKNDLLGRSYYHKNWKHKAYNGQQNMLIAGVDSIGRFFLVSNVRGGSPDQNIHDRIKINIGSDEYTLISDTLMGPFKSHQTLLCACRWEVSVYSGQGALKLGKTITQNMNAPIKCMFTTPDKVIRTATLSRKEKENIKDCYKLSKRIHALADIKKELDTLKAVMNKT